MGMKHRGHTEPAGAPKRRFAGCSAVGRWGMRDGFRFVPAADAPRGGGGYFTRMSSPPFLSVRTSNSRAWPMETFVILRYFAVRATFSGSTTS